MNQPKRIRRTAEDARRQILDAADARLARTGPAGIRLQDVAADVGISHPVILHHFGSREGLIRALTNRAVGEFQEKLLRALDARANTESVLTEVFNTMRHGLAQRLAWLALTSAGDKQAGEDTALQQIVRIVHEHRKLDMPEGAEIDPLDTSLTVYLVAVAAFGDAIFGPQLRRSAGLPEESDAAGTFETWFATLIHNYLDGRPPAG